MRKIKKYSNRRLYDSTASSYINIDELLQLVRDGEEIQVVEDSTGKDITNNILLQSVLEHNSSVNLFPTSLLHRLIRLQSKEDVQGTLSEKVASGLQMLDAQLAKLEGSNWSNIAGWNPFGTTEKPEGSTEDVSVDSDSSAQVENQNETVEEEQGDKERQADPIPETPKKSVVDQQLDTIRAHIASLESRLRKK